MLIPAEEHGRPDKWQPTCRDVLLRLFFFDRAGSGIENCVMKTAQPTKDRILQSGLHLLSRDGLSGVTLGILAETVGMSKSGVFAHFKNKEEVQIGILKEMAGLADRHIATPAVGKLKGLPKLRAIFGNWLVWWNNAGLPGGCPAAAAMFELDDVEGPVRDAVLQMEENWRADLALLTKNAIELGHLRPDTDVGQFVWELTGIYLAHHVSQRFVRDATSKKKAMQAFEALIARGLP